MTEHNYLWFRYRTLHSASAGEWQWQTYAIPAKIKTKAARENFFRENYVEELNDDLNTHSEHWRGIEFECLPAPSHIVAKKIERLQAEMAHTQTRLNRLKFELPLAPVVDVNAKAKKECRSWPKCGCLKQGKHESCIAPYKPLTRS